MYIGHWGAYPAMQVRASARSQSFMSIAVLTNSYGPADDHCRQKNNPAITSPVTTMPARSQGAGMRRATLAPP